MFCNKLLSFNNINQSIKTVSRNISKCVYIKGLPTNTAEFQIKNALQHYGNIEYIKVYNTQGYKNSNCLVGFSDVDSAIAVVDELDQRILLHNYRVTVAYSSRRYYGHNKNHNGRNVNGGVYRKTNNNMNQNNRASTVSN